MAIAYAMEGADVVILYNERIGLMLKCHTKSKWKKKGDSASTSKPMYSNNASRQ